MIKVRKCMDPLPQIEEMKRIVSLLLVLLLLPVCAGAELTAWFLDVGQGDCTVIVCDGEAMIIDGGRGAEGLFLYPG